MSEAADHPAPSRPVSASQPKIPILREILANQAAPPYTLAAFTAYLSQKQCLENLEFTMDAQRYTKRYDELAAELIGMPMSPEIEECRELSLAWQRLLNAYITHGAPKEVNLPDHIHRELLQCQDRRGMIGAPPAPEILERAVEHIYELMDESIMMSFISDMAPKAPTPHSSVYHAKNSSTNELGIHFDSDEERRNRGHGKLSVMSHSRNRSRSRPKYSPEPGSGSESSLGASALPVQPPRISTTSTSGGINPAASRRSIGSGTSGDVIMEDASQPSSPSDMMTPPTTPPGAEFGSGGSPRSRPGETRFRKIMGRLSTKRSTGGSGR